MAREGEREERRYERSVEEMRESTRVGQAATRAGMKGVGRGFAGSAKEVRLARRRGGEGRWEEGRRARFEVKGMGAERVEVETRGWESRGRLAAFGGREGLRSSTSTMMMSSSSLPKLCSTAGSALIVSSSPSWSSSSSSSLSDSDS